MDEASVVKNLIKYNQHVVIATASAEGKPWISPVFYVYDESFNFYWVSAKSALHSKNIRSNAHVALSVFGPSSHDDEVNSKIHGVYIDAEAIELNDEAEVGKAAKIMQRRVQPDRFMIKSLSDVTGNAAWRIYKAVPKEFSKRQDAVDEASGQTVSIRKIIAL